MPFPRGEPSSGPATFLAAAARVVTGNGDEEIGVDQYTAAEFSLVITAASGTTPTLNVYIQKKTPSGHWTDIIAFNQKVTTGREHADFISGGNRVYAEQDGALTAGNTHTTLLGNKLRAKWVIGGTNPSFTFSISATFYT